MFEAQFWAFAVSNYYLVTGNLVDRRLLAERAGVDVALTKVNGRPLARTKDDRPSGMALDDMLKALGGAGSENQTLDSAVPAARAPAEVIQGVLF